MLLTGLPIQKKYKPPERLMQKKVKSVERLKMQNGEGGKKITLLKPPRFGVPLIQKNHAASFVRVALEYATPRGGIPQRMCSAFLPPNAENARIVAFPSRLDTMWIIFSRLREADQTGRAICNCFVPDAIKRNRRKTQLIGLARKELCCDDWFAL